MHFPPVLIDVHRRRLDPEFYGRILDVIRIVNRKKNHSGGAREREFGGGLRLRVPRRSGNDDNQTDLDGLFELGRGRVDGVRATALGDRAQTRSRIAAAANMARQRAASAAGQCFTIQHQFTYLIEVGHGGHGRIVHDSPAKQEGGGRAEFISRPVA